MTIRDAAAEATHIREVPTTRPADPGAPSPSIPDAVEPSSGTPSTSAAREAWRAMLALTFSGEAPSRMHIVCQELDLTPAALKMLMVLSSGPRPMRALVETFRYDPSYLTSIVDLLERRGVARREPHPTDRRAKTVALTEEGERVLARAQELLSVPPESLRRLSTDDQAQLLRLLLRVVDAEPRILEALRPHPVGPPPA
ncbi:Transcriptional regulator, MarR family [Frankia sp. AiPs1]|uniref:MarR family winged helix-turn-helix transcriptional regulator n=1 Tax=Frankia sp. AiPa1 TaxID=573492 RepID=UPI00202B1878|nr:MarR family transcriptional regulator [Frankia sp. AiPa1]MCL9761269.1 MarR family transcriptional regulator [Frankia sp. AiPa1]